MQAAQRKNQAPLAPQTGLEYFRILDFQFVWMGTYGHNMGQLGTMEQDRCHHMYPRWQNSRKHSRIICDCSSDPIRLA